MERTLADFFRLQEIILAIHRGITRLMDYEKMIIVYLPGDKKRGLAGSYTSYP
jgi:hypothetical protein